MRHRLVFFTLLLAAPMAVGIALGLAAQLVFSALILGYIAGALHERRVIVRQIERRMLEDFSAFAERTLAQQPDEDDLDDDQRVVRDMLQRDYHAAQRELGRRR